MVARGTCLGSREGGEATFGKGDDEVDQGQDEPPHHGSQRRMGGIARDLRHDVVT